MVRFSVFVAVISTVGCASGPPTDARPAPAAAASAGAPPSGATAAASSGAPPSGATAVPASTGSTPSKPPPNPCATDPAFRQFDFWVGNWDVTSPKGKKQGENQISKVEAGCLIVERWRSVSGNTGQSYNYYDPVTKKWRQVWVSQGMSIDYEGGLRAADGAMVLQGEIHYHNGTSFPFRGEWIPRPDGSVRQHFEQFDPKADKWATWFTGIYRRKAP